MINIPIAEEKSDDEDEDSFELEVHSDQKSSGKYKFKKSDMKSLLIGNTNQIYMEVKRASYLSMNTFWPRNCYFSGKLTLRKNREIWNYSKPISQEM